MNVFGYNLTDSNKTTRIRNNYLYSTNPGMSNLYFAYSSRSNAEWGSSVTIYTQGIYALYRTGEPESGTIAGTPDEHDYFVSLFGEDTITFRIIKAGKYRAESSEEPGEEYRIWDSPFLMFAENSTTFDGSAATSFDTLLSNQNSANINPTIKIYRYTEEDGLQQVAYAVEPFTINTVFNSTGVLYDSPTACKLTTIGNSENLADFTNLYFVRNIVDGSYAKCFNLSQNTINKLLTNTINLDETTYELTNSSGVMIINGLRYKSYVKINSVDYALIFEYPTGDGTKNIVVTTENFASYADGSNETLGIFADTNLDEINVNSNRVSALDISLINSSVDFKNFLDFGYATMPAVASNDEFFKFLMNDDFVEHNKIPLSSISWLTGINMSVVNPGAGFVATSINNNTYYTYLVTGPNSGVADYYNIQNLLLEIDLGTDFADAFNNNYDLRKSGTGYEMSYNSQTIPLTNFKLREIVVYYKSGSEFVPLYYARCRISVNNSNDYKFQIII